MAGKMRWKLQALQGDEAEIASYMSLATQGLLS
jgi:hypothetical protein